jgi:hypothetical protein
MVSRKGDLLARRRSRRGWCSSIVPKGAARELDRDGADEDDEDDEGTSRATETARVRSAPGVDNEPENQCDAYRSGAADHFIELGRVHPLGRTSRLTASPQTLGSGP